MFHPAGGASGQLSGQTPGFGTDHVTPVIELVWLLSVMPGSIVGEEAALAFH